MQLLGEREVRSFGRSQYDDDMNLFLDLFLSLLILSCHSKPLQPLQLVQSSVLPSTEKSWPLELVRYYQLAAHAGGSGTGQLGEVANHFVGRPPQFGLPSPSTSCQRFVIIGFAKHHISSILFRLKIYPLPRRYPGTNGRWRRRTRNARHTGMMQWGVSLQEEASFKNWK